MVISNISCFHTFQKGKVGKRSWKKKRIIFIDILCWTTLNLVIFCTFIIWFFFPESSFQTFFFIIILIIKGTLWKLYVIIKYKMYGLLSPLICQYCVAPSPTFPLYRCLSRPWIYINTLTENRNHPLRCHCHNTDWYQYGGSIIQYNNNTGT